MPLAWDDFRVLLAVQRAGSLAKAAKDLGVDKATVGRRLRTLGEALGIQLVERVANGYRLNADSGAAVDAAGRIDAIVRELEARANSRDGAVRVTAPVWFARHVLIPATARFREVHPNLQVNLLTTNEMLDLGKREADIAVRNVRPTQQSFVVRRAGVLGTALYASAAYGTARGRPQTRDALRGHHVIAYSDRITYSPGFTWLESAGLHVAFRATDTIAIHDAASAGIGLAALPCFIGDADPELERLEAFGVDPDEIWLVSHEDSRDSPRIRAVTQWIADLFEEHARELSGEAIGSRGKHRLSPPLR